MTRPRAPWIALLGGIIVPLSFLPAHGRELTIDQRVDCQRAVENVYWQHRLWPSENPGAKPALSEVLSDGALRAKVETSLRHSAALEMWGLPITDKDLQSEMARMARASHRPEMLDEIFTALGHDPFLVAECLVRPILADQRLSALAESDRAVSDWWKEEGPAMPAEIAPASDTFTLVPLQTTVACLNDTWAPTTLTGAPFARSGHATLWTGSEVIVYGGMTFFGGTFDSGAFYDPATDSWRTLPRVGAADEGGLGTSAVWTGTKMISWGGGYIGDFGGGVWNKGGKYDPASNAWQTTSTGPNVPSPRWEHTAVWTGTKMIVWGGDDSSSALATGGVYDPVADDWRVTNTGSVCTTGPLNGHGCQADENCPGTCSGGANNAGACSGNQDCLGGCQNNPAVRCAINTECSSQGLGKCTNPPPGTCGNAGACQGGAFHPAGASSPSAVWTGDRMIVWGLPGSGGAVYDVGTDTWTPISTLNAPSFDYSSAVWTGSGMIVWGFYGGGRYDPAGDTWAPVSSVNAPSPRVGPTVVWTGDEMIIWGGSNLDSGGRYRPSTNTWQSTSLLNAPTGRQSHTAAWTGSEMVIWGGNFSNTGGRYCATPACAVQIWYHDSDGDGYGLGGVSVLSCTQPSGYTASAGDCNDASASVHPGVAEVCGDGIDNDCDGIADDAGALAGSSSMSVTAVAGGSVSWTPIAGANVYDLVRGSLGVLASSHGDFSLATSACLGNDLLATSQSDAAVPYPGQGYWYLVRGVNCAGPGTFDSGAPSQSGSRDAEIQASGHACP